MPENDFPLEPAPAEMREMAERVTDLIVEHLAGLEEQPASQNDPSPQLLSALAALPPEKPGELDPLLHLAHRAADAAYESAGPSYLAYIPGGGIFSAALGEYLAAGLNRYTGRALPAPALVALEESVLRWLCGLFSFPAGSQGLLTTGGSISNLIALAAARTAHAEGATDRATIYVGEHGHGSLAKAARTAGLAREHVRAVRSTPELRMDADHLRERLRQDREAGLLPVCICAAAGTTNTGTVDPLEEIADVAREAGVWYHVDAAYGGFFQLTARGRAQLGGIERADSITLDPHKSLFLPFGTGALVVRSAAALRRTFTQEADYMQDLGDTGALPDFDTLSPELTREFRGLRLWLPLHLHGVDAFRRALDEKIDLAREAYQTLAADSRFDVPWTPDLSVVVFRLAGADDAAQLRLLERINASQRVLLSSTRVEGRVFLRIAVLSLRTHRDRVEELLEIISRAAEEEGKEV